MSQFDKEYYTTLNYSGYRDREPKYHKLSSEIVELLKSLSLIQETTTILDYGCAFGYLMTGLINLGYKNVVGYDISKFATDIASMRNLNMLATPEGKFDIMFSLDVFEHMTDKQLTDLFAKISSNILIGRIPVSQDGIDFVLDVSRKDKTHINCKTKEQWKKQINDWGYSTILHINLFSIYDSAGVFCFLAIK